MATLSVNVAANTVSPSYDFSNLAPRLVSFRTGGLITGVIGIVIQPWRLLANPHIYIYVWLGFYGGLLGAVAGVLIADYWLIRRTDLRLVDLYRPYGSYWYGGGWNWRAVLALGAGALLAVGGAWSAPGQGPFPADGLIPAIVTDAASGEVLMLAYMNAEALHLTIKSRIGHFWSRSRQELWKKGRESGNLLKVVEMRTDCDQDVIWMQVEVQGDGLACHTGRVSCFYRKVRPGSGGDDKVSLTPLVPARRR